MDRVLRVSVLGGALRRALDPAWDLLTTSRATRARRDYLERSQWRSEEDLLAVQSGALRRLLVHAHENVPFYGARMGARPAPLASLPTLGREEARLTRGERRSLAVPSSHDTPSGHWRDAALARARAWAEGAVADTYVNAEVGLVAGECAAQAGLHVAVENVVVEILTGLEGWQGRARDGEPGRIVLTDLHNLAEPLIRYETGDTGAMVGHQRCSCGRGLPRISVHPRAPFR